MLLRVTRHLRRFASVAAGLWLGCPSGDPDMGVGAMGASVWLGLAGSILLLLRDRAAVMVLAGRVLAALVSLAWGVMAMVTACPYLVGWTWCASRQLTAVALGCWLYARVAKRSGAL